MVSKNNLSDSISVSVISNCSMRECKWWMVWWTIFKFLKLFSWVSIQNCPDGLKEEQLRSHYRSIYIWLRISAITTPGVWGAFVRVIAVPKWAAKGVWHEYVKKTGYKEWLGLEREENNCRVRDGDVTCFVVRVVLWLIKGVMLQSLDRWVVSTGVGVNAGCSGDADDSF